MQRVITTILFAVDTSTPTHGQKIPSAVAAPILITLLLIVVVIVLFIGRKRFYVLWLVIPFFHQTFLIEYKCDIFVVFFSNDILCLL